MDDSKDEYDDQRSLVQTATVHVLASPDYRLHIDALACSAVY